jgi:serine/threonine protein kinase/KaiC/GvpD/RAD55 family RecA-like ATPase
VPEIGSGILGGRYTLKRRILAYPGNGPEVWEATDSLENPLLVKTWRFSGDQPDDLYRAQWDLELRNLFRISSSPGAELRLVVLKDAGIDRDAKCLTMVLASPGLVTLEALLQERVKTQWLRELADPATRLPVWRALRNLALGLTKLHEQHMLHRDISPRAVFVDPRLGPESMRLGGFELTVRVGSFRPEDAAARYLAPEFYSNSLATHTFESDWYQFGSLVATVLVGGASPAEANPQGRHSEILRRVQDDKKLQELERDLLLLLLSLDPKSRLSRGFEVVQAIDDVILRLGQPVQLDPNSYLALVVLLGGSSPLTTAILEQDESINALAIESQRSFIENDLRTARVVRPLSTGSESYLLQGNRLVYEIVEEREGSSSLSGAWNVAFCPHPKQITYSEGEDDQVEVDRVRVKVFPVATWKKNPTIVQQNSISWKPYLPTADPAMVAYHRQERFHEFFRVTNQIELLFRDAEVFAYQIIRDQSSELVQQIVIEEIARARPVFRHAKIQGGLLGFLKSQIEEQKKGVHLVYLGPQESLFIGRDVDEPEFWTIKEIDDEQRQISLERTGVGFPKPPTRGYVRAFGMFGQLPLIDRRKNAIEKLGEHTYLLQALQLPDTRFIDSGDASALSDIDPSKVDAAKQEALRNIWRTRPLFTLQGPPGTGKTTLVAHLLGAILKDDPVAQILVTAQAHSAVDVLKNKVTDEIFQDDKEDNLPLALRLSKKGNREEDEHKDPDTIRNVTIRILKRAAAAVSTANPIGAEWLEVVRECTRSLLSNTASLDATDVSELVRRAANITYSTTTGGGLEELANMTQSFDWSIIEEAGKAHGFDLVLPLQTGHRWLLIGDQNQLPPYRFEDFLKCLSALEEVMDALIELPGGAGNLVDRDLIYTWRGLTTEEVAQREELWKAWLPFFKHLYDTCYERIPREEGRAVLASMLDQQHRMHPTIAGLISTAYYDTPIVSMTVDASGEPKPRVRHPFTVPAEIAGKALVWLDVPWARTLVPRHGRGLDSGNESSLVEVQTVMHFVRLLSVHSDIPEQLKLAVLSPYRKQVALLRKELRGLYQAPPSWLLPLAPDETPASTVDAYQGNQADIVIVSLVRNNGLPRGDGLGFLKFPERMNVLFSRAERLLVLVGSWDFFRHQLVDAPPIRGQHLGHLKLAMQYIERSIITEKTACKLSSGQLTLGRS